MTTQLKMFLLNESRHLMRVALKEKWADDIAAIRAEANSLMPIPHTLPARNMFVYFLH